MRVFSINRPAIALLLLAFLAIVYILINLPQPSPQFSPRGILRCPQSPLAPPSNKTRRIPCVIDGHRRFSCLRDGDDVYFPFDKFIRKQFDATGRLVDGDGNVTRFEYFSSYSKVRLPEFSTYDPVGPFGHFASYNVENRDRVRCMKNGVPMSVQWNSTPYFYPIQIAQFALQHYSRNFTGETAVAEEDVTTPWKASSSECKAVMGSESTELTCAVADGSMSKNLEKLNPNLLVVVFEWLPISDASFTFTIEHARLNKRLVLNYLPSDDDRCLLAEDDFEFNLYLNLPKSSDTGEFTKIARDILVDVNKALAIVEKSKIDKSAQVVKLGDIRLVEILFKGHSRIRGQVALKASAHVEMFLTAADWFVDNQNDRGGWAVPVQRSIADNKLILKAGWHSAMAQGHGLSVLTRAYVATKKEKYLSAADKALQLFKTPASEGGVLNRLFDHDWYEEYPTTPGTFVVNGFMYSLLGLYDMSQLGAGDSQHATELYKTGLRSLKTFLPLYDTGSGSLYDLRHLGIGSAPNLARWDYHAVHIYLLKWLYHIDGDEKLNAVADRWVNYAKGKKAKHN
ncbi:hypothetical protein QR680_012086 [Steinernema hermaphroditum]|uniref:heparosan-N-sulfate-glucuronate 5-epimerase n=1 Tax=Steinernema hermaphroditum TaxID=289476 RepID=A0AA39I2S4_9BILA|nr:hypothetical protein QR680_012086 [Steinernema hermaphroditum]